MYFLEIDKEHKDYLGGIRHWDNLKVAFEGQSVWVKDFLEEQLNASEIQQIPFQTIFELKENLLFKRGSLLPAKKLPSGLLWTPILRALPVVLPQLNHNYFGIHQTVEMTLKPSEKERAAFALLTDYDEVKLYIETAPEFRLQPLKWVVIDKKVLIMGTPLLPIKGVAYWKDTDFLLPTGYDFEWPVLSKTLQQNLNSSGENVMLWHADNSYSEIPKNNMKPLSISSFRLTFS